MILKCHPRKMPSRLGVGWIDFTVAIPPQWYKPRTGHGRSTKVWVGETLVPWEVTRQGLLVPRCAARYLLRVVFLKQGAGGLQFLALGCIYFGISQLEFFQRIHDNRRHHGSGEPFIVRRHHVPRSVLGGGFLDHLFEGFPVVLPVAAFTNVGGGKFPVLPRIVEAFLESAFLF